MLLGCIKKLGKQLDSGTRAELEALLAQHDDPKTYDAGIAALTDYHKTLFDAANEIRSRVRPRMDAVPYQPYDPKAVNQKFEKQLQAARRGGAKQTATEAFKRWFGDSKVVDAKSDPLVVYHGTFADDFDAFSTKADSQRPGGKAADSEHALFFTDSAQGAGKFAQFDEETPLPRDARVIPTFLRMENPYTSDMLLDSSRDSVKGAARTIQLAKDHGHDGVIFTNSDLWGTNAKTYAVFNPNQIKSATGNRGTFDRADPNILHARESLADEPRFLGGRFFSQLYRAIAQKMQPKASAADIRKIVENPQNGVKADEIKWSGLDDYLKEHPETTRRELLEFLRASGIQIEEKKLGGKGEITDGEEAEGKAYADPVVRMHIDRMEQTHGLRFQVDPGDVNQVAWFDNDTEDLVDTDDILRDYGQEPFKAAQKAIQAYSDMMTALEVPPTKFGQYTVPGKSENYREILFTLPDKELKIVIGKPEPFNGDGYAMWQGQQPVRGVMEYPVSGDIAEGHITYWPHTYKFNGAKGPAKYVVYTSHVQNAQMDSMEDAERVIREAYAREPQLRKDTFQSPHWQGTPNVMAHARADDRKTSDGKKGLMVIEVQSDQHQKARKIREKEIERLVEAARVRNNDKAPTKEERAIIARAVAADFGYRTGKEYDWHVKVYSKALEKDMDLAVNFPTKEAAQAWIDSNDGQYFQKVYKSDGQTLRIEQGREREYPVSDKVPAAPFSKNWHEFVMRRMLADAVEKGYDYLLWATGDQQLKIYPSLSTLIDKLQYTQREGGWLLVGHKDGREKLRKDVPDHELEDYVGEEAAKKIRATAPTGYTINERRNGTWELVDPDGTARGQHNATFRHEGGELVPVPTTQSMAQALADKLNAELTPRIEGTLSGLDLEIGGQGMRGFYDKILPDYMRRLVKKWGGKVEDVALGGVETPKEIAIRVSKRLMDENDTGNIPELIWEQLTDGGATVEEAMETARQESELQIKDAEEQGYDSGPMMDAYLRVEKEINDAVKQAQPAMDYDGAITALNRLVDQAANEDNPNLVEVAADVLRRMREGKTWEKASQPIGGQDQKLYTEVRERVAAIHAKAGAGSIVHAVRITDEMRDSIMADGQPLFARRGKEKPKPKPKGTAAERVKAAMAARGKTIPETTPRRTQPTPATAATTSTPTASPTIGGATTRETASAPAPSRTAGPETKERSFPKTAERAGHTGGTDRDYRVLSNPESLARAERRILKLGNGPAAAELAQAEEPGAEEGAMGILLIQRFEKAGQIERAVAVANDLSRKYTRAGQFVQSASIISRLSPEGILLAAQRRMKGGRELSAEVGQTVVAQARAITEAEQLIAKIQKERPDIFGPDGAILPYVSPAVTRLNEPRDSKSRPLTRKQARQRIGKLADRLSQMEQDARARMAARSAGPGATGTQAGATTVLPDIADLIIIGASKLARAGITRATWMAEMAIEAAHLNRKELKKLYRDSFRMYEDERKRFLQESRERGAERVIAAETGEGPRQDRQTVINNRLDAMTQARKARAELAKTFQNLNVSGLTKAGRHLRDVVNLTRSLITSVDLSAAGRQGKMGLVPHPKAFLRGFLRQFKALSTKQHDRMLSAREARPSHKYAVRFGLELTSEAASLAEHEEAYQSELAREIPWIKHSEQAYNTMLDELRLGWFEDMMEKWQKAGLDLENRDHLEQFRMDTALINQFTGRGGGRRLKQAAPILNMGAFSARFWASRLQVLSLPLNPRMYGIQVGDKPAYSAAARKEAWKTLFGFYALVGAELTLASLAGATVSFDPDDPDFLKARWGKIHIDFSAGLQSHLRVAARMARTFYLREHRKQQPRVSPADIAQHYLRSKEAPNVALLHDLFISDKKQTEDGLRGTNIVGEPVYLLGKKGERWRTSALAQRALPIVIQDALDAYHQAIPLPQAAASLTASFFGEGATTYEKRYREDKDKFPMEAEREKLGVTISPPQRIKPGKYESFKGETDEEYDARRKAEAASVKQALGELSNQSYYNTLTAQEKEKEIRLTVRQARQLAREKLPAPQRKAAAVQ